MKLSTFFDSENKWTQKVYARNASNSIVADNDINAVKWCLMSAIYKLNLNHHEIETKIRNTPTFKDFEEKFLAENPKLHNANLVNFNDYRKTNFSVLIKALREAGV